MCATAVSANGSLAFRRELYLLALIAGLYISFLVWGYLQEKITTTAYVREGDDKAQYWEHATVLNFCVAVVSSVVAMMGEKLTAAKNTSSTATFASYAWAALTCAVASPLGYFSLRYISFPLQMLTKSCKLVPVMLIGTLVYQRKYSLSDYMSVALITFGIALFSLAKAQKPALQIADDTATHSEALSPHVQQLLGIVLVCANIMLDGFTNQEQERIKQNYKIGALEMMKNINFWQCIYLGGFLLWGFVTFGEGSDAYQAWAMIESLPQLRWDVLAFAGCAAFGQVFVFAILHSFGPVVLVTCTVTRKLFQVLLSVAIFGHAVSFAQWIGIVLVFIGIGVNTFYSRKSSSKKSKAE